MPLQVCYTIICLNHTSKLTACRTGFDPIFYLHHCQVDRILALWSALNPDVWVTESVDCDGTWTIPGGTTVNANTGAPLTLTGLSFWLISASSSDLTPFRNTQSTFWTSAESAGPHKLGYTYPEFNDIDLGNQEAVKVHITHIVEKLYGGSSGGGRIFAPAANVAVTAREKEAPVHIDSVASTKPAASAPAQTLVPRGIAAQDDEPQRQVTFGEMPTSSIAGDYRDWTVCVHVKKYEVGGSFSVLLDRKSTRLNSSHSGESRMPSSA